MTPLLELSNVTIRAPGGRHLFEALDLRLGRDRVALVGRNGVGKSTLLSVLAGNTDPDLGRATSRGRRHWVPQLLDFEDRRSRGERRKRALSEARSSLADILLLDEPTEDLDDDGVAWVREWLRAFEGCVVVASHDRRLLADFEHFFVASESGCRHFAGSLAALEDALDHAYLESERRYLGELQRLADRETRSVHIARRKARKRRYGRCSELDRATPRIRLNQKRDLAQDSHGRLAKLQAERIEEARAWACAMRRAIPVSLAVELPRYPLAGPVAEDAVVLGGVSVRIGDRALFENIELRLGRRRVAVVGPNGADKSTLLDVVIGRRRPTTGTATRTIPKIGTIAQGATDWMLDESLASCLAAGSRASLDIAKLLAAHRFPLALAERPMSSLSPGERTRAALLCLWHRTPGPHVLVLDEPTFSLDLVGQRAIVQALRSFPGGLIVASHDREFLEEIGVDEWIELGDGY